MFLSSCELSRKLLISLLIVLITVTKIEGSHFRGGTISWKPSNPSATGSSVNVDITMRLFWDLSRFPACNSPSDFGNLYGDASYMTPLSGPYWSISTETYCDGISTSDQWSSGSRTQTVSVTTTQVSSSTFETL